jgi:hypothetical protein
MRWLSFLLIAGAVACDNADGTRAECAEGGTLTACPEAERTAEGACWRLVDCAAIQLHSDDNNDFDWDNCVDNVEQRTSDREQLIIDCIAAATCDSLKTNPQSCFLLGDTP